MSLKHQIQAIRFSSKLLSPLISLAAPPSATPFLSEDPPTLFSDISDYLGKLSVHLLTATVTVATT